MVIDVHLRLPAFTRTFFPLEPGEVKSSVDDAPDGFRTESDTELRQRVLQAVNQRSKIKT